MVSSTRITWPPTVVHHDGWFRVGGCSSERSPDMSSDNDFSIKLRRAGCRHFVGGSSALVCPFRCRPTGRIVKNDGRRQCLHKRGIRPSPFDSFYLRRGAPLADPAAPLAEPEDGLQLRWARSRNGGQRRLGR